ncbi:MAG: DUF1330 domain-containing protein [Alphaproteobacteria bacterium]|jgi:uncharacterized protein (DUF1330 family)|nr:DUF1330 domain-containing protein [Alphaproteobacteria bacterium]
MKMLCRALFALGVFVATLSLFLSSAEAQTKTVAYAVVELDVRQPEEFSKEFFPLAAKIFAEAGGVFVARPTAPVAIDDIAPKRVAIIRFDSVDKAKATFASEAYRDARKIGDKYASFKIFVLEAPAP